MKQFSRRQLASEGSRLVSPPFCLFSLFNTFPKMSKNSLEFLGWGAYVGRSLNIVLSKPIFTLDVKVLAESAETHCVPGQLIVKLICASVCRWSHRNSWCIVLCSEGTSQTDKQRSNLLFEDNLRIMSRSRCFSLRVIVCIHYLHYIIWGLDAWLCMCVNSVSY